MKQITCAQMGGPATCNFVISGNTPEEMVKKGTDHVKTSHPEMAKDIEKMTKEENDKWFEEFKIQVAALPEL